MMMLHFSFFHQRRLSVGDSVCLKGKTDSVVIRRVIIEVFYIPAVARSSVHDSDRNEEEMGG